MSDTFVELTSELENVSEEINKRNRQMKVIESIKQKLRRMIEGKCSTQMYIDLKQKGERRIKNRQ